MMSHSFRNTVKYIFVLCVWLFTRFRRRTPGQAQNTLNGAKCLVLSVSGIGNGILCSPLLQALKDHGARTVDVLIPGKTHQVIFSGLDSCDNTIIMANSAFKFWQQLFELRKRKYDVLLLAFPTPEIGFIVSNLFIKAGTSVAHDYHLFHPYFQFIKRAVDHIIPIETELHDIEQNMNLLRVFGLADIPFEKYPLVKFSDDAYLEADGFLSANRISATAKRLFMHPGCNRGAEHKRWPVQHFVELGCALREKYDVEIFVILGPDESEYREFFDRPEFHIVESMSFAAILALLSTADLLVSNDSGIMHSAALLRVPVVTIWGGTDERRNGARGTVAVNIKNMAIECRPCARFVAKLNCPDIKFECVRSISVKTVYDSIEENRFLAISDNQLLREVE